MLLTALVAVLLAVAAFLVPDPAWATASSTLPLDLTASTFGLIAVLVFIAAYGFVVSEEVLHVRKSKPVIVAAGVIWVLVAMAYAAEGDTHMPSELLRHNIMEYAELMLFLLAAMTYINTMEERRVFAALRGWLVSRDFSLYSVFWVTGVLAFLISPIADNLTTALLMAAVVMAVAGDRKQFVAVACVNIVVAANAGGAFSPFGDITTLMVWQKGIVRFEEFFALFLPSVVNWLIPAILMSFVVPKEKAHASEGDTQIKPGGLIVIALFLLTIASAVSMHHFFHLPPMLGMMTGLGLLKIYGYVIRRRELSRFEIEGPEQADSDVDPGLLVRYKPRQRPFDIFISMKRAEWDTLMFFYGVILCVGGLGALGYLAMVSEMFYTDLGATTANVLVGIVSAIVDNIPVMFAVLSMNPDMAHGQWLLVTLTAGVGGSLLSIGSAAGVALMGQARGRYTFFQHLKWTPAIALGYAASIWLHLVMNARHF
jgi:NhaD family Na+/H+ antiporter